MNEPTAIAAMTPAESESTRLRTALHELSQLHDVKAVVTEGSTLASTAETQEPWLLYVIHLQYWLAAHVPHCEKAAHTRPVDPEVGQAAFDVPNG